MNLAELMNGAGFTDEVCRFGVLTALGTVALIVLFFVGLSLGWWPDKCPTGALRWFWQTCAVR